MPKPVNMKDLGIGELRKQLDELRQTRVTVGWQGESGAATHPGTDENNATIASWMEHGTKRMPARPALQVTFDRHRDDFVAAARKAVSDLVDGRSDSVEDAQRSLGLTAVDKLRDVIDEADRWAEPLADSTIKAKGHAQPWVATFTLRENASYAVRKGDQIVSQGGENDELGNTR